MSIKVFGATACPGCVTVKTLLNKRGIAFTEYDVNNIDDMEAAMAYNVRSIPTLVIGKVSGDDVYVGASQCVNAINDMGV